MIWKRMLIFASATVVFLLSLATLNHFTKLRVAPSRQKPFVGFSLGPASASIAIDFANGTVWTDEVDGDDTYRIVMMRLSWESSRHPAPPYREVGSRWADLGRVLVRKSRKAVGLPASTDVDTLSTVIKPLVERAEQKLGLRISAATMTVPMIAGIYQDDVSDILQYVGLHYFHYGDIVRDMLYEPLAAYAGYGFGLCEHWEDQDRCRGELDGYPSRTALTVHYAPNTLMLVVSSLLPASDRSYPHSNFDLGSRCARNRDGSDNEPYWELVDAEVEQRLAQFFGRHYDVIMFVGQSAPQTMDDRLARIVLEKVMKQPYQEERPEYIMLNDSTSAAARGAAEFVKRRSPEPLDLAVPSQQKSSIEL